MRKLLSYIATPVLWNLSNFIMRQRYYTACTIAKTALPELLPQVAKSLYKQRKEGGLSHEFSELKLLELAEFLWKYKPETILELGGGGTTAVLASYASTNPKIRIISVDENSDYLNATKERIDPALQSCISFRHCPRQEAKDQNGTLTCFYQNNWQDELNTNRIDLIYVDGPTTTNNSGIKMPCADVARLSNENWRIGHVLFDVRIPSVRYCAESIGLAGHRFHLHRNALSPKNNPWVVEAVRHHSWFEPSPIDRTQSDHKKSPKST